MDCSGDGGRRVAYGARPPDRRWGLAAAGALAAAADGGVKEIKVEKGLKNFLARHGAAGPVSFHMPGHKGMKLFAELGCDEFLRRAADWDITEIRGADNLFQAESVIAEVMEKYQQLYGARKSYLLVNGSSGGIIASILATVHRGGALVMGRNSHKSAYNALRLGDARPVYARPELIEEYGVQGRISAAEIASCLDEHPEAEAVIIASPNYYGVCSDVEKIAAAVHERGKILIVDQAHGAHLKFFGQLAASLAAEDSAPGRSAASLAAEDLGADLVINSTHKTLASFTQTAVLNVCSERVDLDELEDKLQMIESSSPSYPLMATLDVNADLLLTRGEELIARWRDNVDWFYAQAESVPGLSVMRTAGLDATKINLDASAAGYSGDALEDFLIERNIFPELVSGNIVMCMSGIGNVRGDYEKLLAALQEAAAQPRPRPADPGEQATGPQPPDATDSQSPDAAGPQSLGAAGPQSLGAAGSRETTADYASHTLRQAAIPRQKTRIALEEAEGRVSAALLIPYPPGIPIACPGEVIDRQVIDFIIAARRAGRKVIGVSPQMEILVGEEK